MTSYVALLRAVNVGGTGKLPMAELKVMADVLGFTGARTYIASGNLLFRSSLGEAEVKAALEARLAACAGRPVGVLVRTAAELAEIRDTNPFPDAPGHRVVAILLDTAPSADALAHARHVNGEEMALGGREIYVRYSDTGMAGSKLVIPAARLGTGRNMNTVVKLAELASAPLL